MAGHSVTPDLPVGPRWLPPFELPDTRGLPVRSSFFLGRLAIALALAGEEVDDAWIAQAVAAERQMREWGVETLWVAAVPPDKRVSPVVEALLAAGAAGLILIDAGGRLHRKLAATDVPRPALLVLERGGEVRCRIDRVENEPFDLRPAVEWARYLAVLEPECGTCVPAWPEHNL